MLNSEGCKLYKLCCRLQCLLKSRCDVVLKLRPPAFACSSGKVVVPAEGFETGPVLVEDVIILIRPGYDHMQTGNKMPCLLCLRCSGRRPNIFGANDGACGAPGQGVSGSLETHLPGRAQDGRLVRKLSKSSSALSGRAWVRAKSDRE